MLRSRSGSIAMSEGIKVTVVRYGKRKCYMMRYTDPVTGKRPARSTGETIRRKAERKAALWQADLNAGKYFAPNKITWDDFRLRYEMEKFPALAEKTQASGKTALNHLERIIHPKLLQSITGPVLSEFQTKLRKGGMKEVTIAAYLRHLRAALSWAVKMEMLPKVPKIEMPKRAKGKAMRGRPITPAELDRMIEAVAQVRPEDSTEWERYLIGLWFSGLRLRESLALSWDDDAPFRIDLTGDFPRLKILGEAQKNGKDQTLPITPEFAEWLLLTPKAKRRGPVFRLLGAVTGEPITPNRVADIVRMIAKKAGVEVGRERKKKKRKGRPVEIEVIKWAGPHDFRRAFGTRWARQTMPAELRRLMRHESIETTMRFYVDIDSDEIARALWAKHSATKEAGSGNTLATSDP